MHEVTRNLTLLRQEEARAKKAQEPADEADPLTATMAFLRAAERANVARMEQCLIDYPHLRQLVGGADPALRGTPQLEAVRSHAVELAQESIT